jgi:hypothetical protein
MHPEWAAAIDQMESACAKLDRMVQEVAAGPEGERRKHYLLGGEFNATAARVTLEASRLILQDPGQLSSDDLREILTVYVQQLEEQVAYQQRRHAEFFEQPEE